MTLTWMARVTGLAVSLLLVLFAFGAFDGRPLATVALDFSMHLLPAALVGAITAVAWRFPWAGAAGFLFLAAAYAVWVPDRPDWILVISGPLALLAALFAASAIGGRRRLAA